MDGNLLNDFEGIKNAVQEIELLPLKTSYHDIRTHIINLRPMGSTALGPALLAGIKLTTMHPGSSVILCTDGLANCGLGSMGNKNDYEKFYARTSDYAIENGVIVNIMSMEGTDANLETIGAVAVNTEGEVDIINSSNVESIVGDMVLNQTLATNVSIKVFSPDFVSMIHPTDVLKTGSIIEHTIGNATRDTNVSIQFNVFEKEDQNIDKFRAQALIYFTKLDKAKCLRVVGIEQRIGNEDVDLEVDSIIMAQHYTRYQNLMEQQVGGPQSSQVRNDLFNNMKKFSKPQSAVYDNFVAVNTARPSSRDEASKNRFKGVQANKKMFI